MNGLIAPLVNVVSIAAYNADSWIGCRSIDVNLSTLESDFDKKGWNNVDFFRDLLLPV